MLTLIPTPIGNLSDITFRALEVLQKAQIILCEDTRVTKQLLNLLSKKFDFKTPNAKIISFFEHNQNRKIDEIKNYLATNNCVYLSDAGMPAISDPGQFLVKFCQENNIIYDVLPGPSVAPLIYAASGFESGKFYFYGFLPKKGKERASELEKILNGSFDTVLYEAPHRILNLLELICKIDKEKELFVAKEISKMHQSYFWGNASEILQKLQSKTVKGEWALVIKGEKKDNKGSIEYKDIINLNLPPKQKAKLLAKISGKSVKECYDKLQNEKNLL
jgi:16S rRNA (cytidine1402-2'-O)-methyltransferase